MNIKSVLMIYLFEEWEIVISTYDWDLFPNEKIELFLSQNCGTTRLYK